VNLPNEDGETPAYIAAQKGHAVALKHLVKAGCDVNQAAKNGKTPADVAAQKGLTAALAAATLEKSNSKRSEKNRKHNMKKKKARAASIEQGAVEEEQPPLRSEELAPSSGPGHERPEADDNNRAALRVVDGVDDYGPSDDSDEEVERCQCVHCLEL
jgi:ankyrin repeat protein